MAGNRLRFHVSRRVGLHWLTFILLFLFGIYVVDPILAPHVEPLALREVREWLRPADVSPDKVPVLVCDISNLYELREGMVYKPVQPAVWKQFFRELREGGEPAAIGFDIDMSSDEPEGFRPEHLAMLGELKRYSSDTGVPGYVGVSRGLFAGPSHWLPENARHLAAAIYLPQDLTAQPAEYEDDRSHESLPVLGAVLGRAAQKPSNFDYRPVFEPRHWTEGTMLLPPEVKAEKFFVVDYSLLKAADLITVAAEAPASGQILSSETRQAMAGKIVIFGRADPLADQDYFSLNDKLQPSGGDITRGIYAHACAAFTMAAAPVQELKPFQSHGLDFLFAFSGLVLTLTWPRMKERGARHFAWHYGGLVVRILIALGPLLLAYVLAHNTRTFWLGFAGTWVYLLMEPLFAPLIEGVGGHGRE